jgi:hypothetical protein
MFWRERRSSRGSSSSVFMIRLYSTSHAAHSAAAWMSGRSADGRDGIAPAATSAAQEAAAGRVRHRLASLRALAPPWSGWRGSCVATAGAVPSSRSARSKARWTKGSRMKVERRSVKVSCLRIVTFRLVIKTNHLVSTTMESKAIAVNYYFGYDT